MLKYKILYLIDNLDTGGGQLYMWELLKHLDKNRYEIDIATWSANGHHFAPIAAQGFRVVPLMKERFSYKFLPASITRLLSFLRGTKYDLVHTFLQGSFAIGTPIARLHNLRTVHTVMAGRIQLQKWIFPLMALYQPWVEAYMGVDHDELRQGGISCNKIKLVEMPVDLRSMSRIVHNPKRRIGSLELEDDFPVAVSIGRLHPDKGHEFGIRAWRKVIGRYPNARLVIVGDGPDEKRLMSIVRELALDSAVLFAGYFDDLESLFSRADILLRTSLNEGVNMVTTQAMAAGLPIIGFTNEARKEFLVNGVSGLHVPLGDFNEMALVIERILENPALGRKLGSQAREGVLDYYNSNRVVDFYDRLYRSIIAGLPIGNVVDMRQKMWPIHHPFKASL